jgi:hypothetical protein
VGVGVSATFVATLLLGTCIGRYKFGRSHHPSSAFGVQDDYQGILDSEPVFNASPPPVDAYMYTPPQPSHLAPSPLTIPAL